MLLLLYSFAHFFQRAIKNNDGTENDTSSTIENDNRPENNNSDTIKILNGAENNSNFTIKNDNGPKVIAEALLRMIMGQKNSKGTLTNDQTVLIRNCWGHVSPKSKFQKLVELFFNCYILLFK